MNPYKLLKGLNLALVKHALWRLLRTLVRKIDAATIQNRPLVDAQRQCSYP